MRIGHRGLPWRLLLGRLPLLLVLALPAGCWHRPVAPALEDSPVYENDREGFRFMVPEDWHQYARSELPPGKLPKECLLVQYRRTKSSPEATLEVSAADLAPSADLAGYLAAPAFGSKEWKLKSPPEALEVNGLPGTRYDFASRLGKEEMDREVVAFRRGERVYFFTTLFYPRDTTAQEQARRAVARIIWRG